MGFHPLEVDPMRIKRPLLLLFVILVSVSYVSALDPELYKEELVWDGNVLDVYPDLNIAANQSSGRFLYSRRSQQFGANGRYVFGRLSFDF